MGWSPPLLRTNMEDLREKTHSQHYELYRRNRLQEMGFADKTADNRPVSLQETYEKKRQQHLREMQSKEERMRQMFVQKVSQLLGRFFKGGFCFGGDETLFLT